MKILKRISVLVLAVLSLMPSMAKSGVVYQRQYSYRQLVEAGKSLEDETCQLDAVVWQAVCGDSIRWRNLG